MNRVEQAFIFLRGLGVFSRVKAFLLAQVGRSRSAADLESAAASELASFERTAALFRAHESSRQESQRPRAAAEKELQRTAEVDAVFDEFDGQDDPRPAVNYADVANVLTGLDKHHRDNLAKDGDAVETTEAMPIFSLPIVMPGPIFGPTVADKTEDHFGIEEMVRVHGPNGLKTRSLVAS